MPFSSRSYYQILLHVANDSFFVLEEGSADLGLLLLDKGKQRLLGFRLGNC